MEQTQLDGLFLSDSPPEKDVQWSDQGLISSSKFLQKIWDLNIQIINLKESNDYKKRWIGLRSSNKLYLQKK